jgi:hypothetical protein
MHSSSAMIVLCQHHHQCKNARRAKKVFELWRGQMVIVNKSNRRSQVDRRHQNDDFDKKQNGLRFGDIVIKDFHHLFSTSQKFWHF